MSVKVHITAIIIISLDCLLFWKIVSLWNMSGHVDVVKAPENDVVNLERVWC